jgi:GAF domain-containing protein
LFIVSGAFVSRDFAVFHWPFHAFFQKKKKLKKTEYSHRKATSNQVYTYRSLRAKTKQTKTKEELSKKMPTDETLQKLLDQQRLEFIKRGHAMLSQQQGGVSGGAGSAVVLPPIRSGSGHHQGHATSVSGALNGVGVGSPTSASAATGLPSSPTTNARSGLGTAAGHGTRRPPTGAYSVMRSIARGTAQQPVSGAGSHQLHAVATPVAVNVSAGAVVVTPAPIFPPSVVATGASTPLGSALQDVLRHLEQRRRDGVALSPAESDLLVRVMAVAPTSAAASLATGTSATRPDVFETPQPANHTGRQQPAAGSNSSDPLGAGPPSSVAQETPRPSGDVGLSFTMSGVEQGESPGASEANNAKRMLNRLRRLVTSDAFVDLVSAKSDVGHLISFAVTCASTTMDEVSLIREIHQQISTILGRSNGEGVSVQTFDGNYVVDVVRGALSQNAKERGDSVATTLNGTSSIVFLDGGIARIALALDGEVYGIIEISDITRDDLPAERKRLLVATAGIAALTLRTATQLDDLEWINRKNLGLVRIANALSSDAFAHESDIIYRTMQRTRELVDAEDAFFFRLDETARELVLFRHPNADDFEEPPTTQMIDAIHGVADVVRRTGDVAIVASTAEEGAHFASGLGIGGTRKASLAIPNGMESQLRSVLAAPVRHEDGRIFAVACLVNRRPRRIARLDVPQVFRQRDAELFQTLCSFVALAVRNTHTAARLRDEKKRREAILQMVQYLGECDIRDVNAVAQRVMHGAKQLLNADRATLFLIDEERGELYSSMADAVGGTVLRFPVGKGIAGRVAATKHAENIVNAYQDARFNKEIDKQTGYRSTSILTVPILSGGDAVAVAQLVNKKDTKTQEIKEFTQEDLDTFNIFGSFAGISIANSRLLDFAVRAGKEAVQISNIDALEFHSPSRSNAAATGCDSDGAVLPQRSPSPSSMFVAHADAVPLEEALRIGEMALSEPMTREIVTPEFDLFTRVIDHPGGREAALDLAAACAVHLIESTGLCKTFGTPRDVLVNFVVRCRTLYRRVPYHNFFHVVDVLQTLHTYLYFSRAHTMLTELEQYTLLLTALVHDLDHMGTNNSYHLKTDSPLGILSSVSGNRSVLEVHHCSLAIEILQDPATGVFDSVPQEDRVRAIKNMMSTVLATDMAFSGEHIEAFQKAIEEGPGYQVDNYRHRQLLMHILLKCADVSNVTKPFSVSRQWATAVTEEFYFQGDKERARGLQVAPMNDRQLGTELAKGQVGFIKFVARRIFATAQAAVTGLQWALDRMERNTEQWEALLSAAPVA